MSSPAVDLVRSIYEKWAVGDFTDDSWASPDIEFVSGYRQSGSGREWMAGEWRDWLGAWAFFTVVPAAWGEVGDDVFVLAHFGGRSKAGGVKAAGFEGASRFTIRDGQVVALRLYPSAAEGLEDAGLDRSQLTSWF